VLKENVSTSVTYNWNSFSAGMQFLYI